MQQQQNLDIYQHVGDTIIALLEQDIIPWRQPWAETGPPRNLLTRHWFTGANYLLLNTLPYAQPYYLTFKQVKAVAGRVKAGERGYLLMYRKAILEPDTIDPSKLVKRFVPRHYFVFNVEQCENIPPSLLGSMKIFPGHRNPIEQCEFVVEDYKTRPTIYLGSGGASYVHKAVFVNMPLRERFVSQEQFYATLFHELVHSTGHESRLNRKEITESPDYETDAYALEELVAEIGAGFLCTHTGIESATIKHHAAYIRSWLRAFNNDKRFFVVAATRAQRAVDYILNIDRSADGTEKASEEQAGR